MQARVQALIADGVPCGGELALESSVGICAPSSPLHACSCMICCRGHARTSTLRWPHVPGYAAHLELPRAAPGPAALQAPQACAHSMHMWAQCTWWQVVVRAPTMGQLHRAVHVRAKAACRVLSQVTQRYTRHQHLGGPVVESLSSGSPRGARARSCTSA